MSGDAVRSRGDAEVVEFPTPRTARPDPRSDDTSMFDAFLTADGLIALATLTFLEVILGVDNVIFISILSGKLPPDQQMRARRTGLVAAMGMRIVLLMSLAWIVKLT